MKEERIAQHLKNIAPWMWDDMIMPYIECGPGWNQLLIELVTDLAKMDKEHSVRVMQIKEKCGGLRFYINAGTPEIFERIDQAELKSYTICEICGNVGKVYGGGWIRTLCQSCAKKQGVK